MKRITERYIPQDSVKVENEDAIAVVYKYNTGGSKFICIGYSGKRKKPDFHINFKTPERRDEFIEDYFKGKIRNIKSKADFKSEQKAQADKMFAEVKVGDIFHSSWGWEQTQCDFYQLIGLKGKTGTFRPIHGETTEELGWASENMKAVPNSFYGDEFKKRLTGSSFKISSFQYVSKVQDINKSFYHSWYA